MSSSESPYPPWSASEASRLYPSSSLRLRHVHVVFRHGERTPMATARYQLALVAKEPLCSANRPVVTVEGDPLLRRGTSTSLRFRSEGQPASGCETSQLTIVGERTMMEMGNRFRELYVERLAFLSPEFKPEEVLVESSALMRTIESAHHLLMGLFPSSTSFVIGTVHNSRETLYPNYRCKEMRRIWDQYKTMIRKELDAEVEPLRQELRKEFDVPKGDFVFIDEFYDYIASARALRVQMNPIFTPAVFEQLDKYMSALWWKPFLLDRTLLRLGVGQLADRMVSRMEENVRTGDGPKLFLYAAHDSTIAPLLISMGIYDGKWPDFAANIELELLERHGKTPESEPGIFVRAMHNGRPRAIVGCPADPSGLMLCPFQKFVELMQDVRIRGEEYQRACQIQPSS